jgi:multimeric flavodoxin WrbA
MDGDDKTRVLVMNGSARAEEGNTDMIVRRFLKGVADAGAEIDIIYPARMNIAHCEADPVSWCFRPTPRRPRTSLTRSSGQGMRR